MVIGGFHLFNPVKRKTENLNSIKKLAMELSLYPDTKFYTGHCTGQKALGNLKEIMKGKIFQFQTGTIIEL